jgi:hypothetical protein
MPLNGLTLFRFDTESLRIIWFMLLEATKFPAPQKFHLPRSLVYGQAGKIPLYLTMAR